MVLNFVVKNEYLFDNDVKTLFGDFNGNIEDVEYIPETLDMYDILVMSNLFKSKSDAKRNWTRTGKEVPCGWSEFKKIGKLNSHLCIWNPSISIEEFIDE